MEQTKIVIIGAGGLGREIGSILIHSAKYEHCGYLDDNLEEGELVNGIEVLGPVRMMKDLSLREFSFAIGIGSPQIRKSLVERSLELNLNFPNIIHDSVIVQDKENVEFGYGNVICAGNIFTTNIKVGNFNLINLSCTIGHDTKIANFCSVMPGVNISGGAQIENGAFIGTGAKLIKAKTIGENSVVGAGAVITTDTEPGSTYVGVPGKRN